MNNLLYYCNKNQQVKPSSGTNNSQDTIDYITYVGFIKNVGKCIVDECNSKKSKACVVREDPLTEEECQMIKMPFGFEGAMYAIGEHINHYTKNNSPSQHKYVYYKGTPDLMPGLSWLSQSLSHFFASVHVAHNGSTLSKMCSIRQLQYEERMLDNADYEGFKIFAEKVVNGEIVDFW